MGISLFVGRLVTPFAETAFACSSCMSAFLAWPATGALARYLKGHPVAGVAALAILVGGFKLISGGPLVCTASFTSQTSLCPTPPPPGRRRRRRSKRIVAECSDVLSAGQLRTGMIDIGWHHTQFEANSLVYDFPVRGTSSVTAEAVHSWHQVESTASERSHRRSSLLHLRLCCCRIPRARAGSWVAADAAKVAKLSDSASDSGRKLRCIAWSALRGLDVGATPRHVAHSNYKKQCVTFDLIGDLAWTQACKQHSWHRKPGSCQEWYTDTHAYKPKKQAGEGATGLCPTAL